MHCASPAECHFQLAPQSCQCGRFGQPSEQWRARTKELRERRFRVNFNQGIRVEAEAIARVCYHDHRVKRRLHAAWDKLGPERTFFRRVERLEAEGVPARPPMVYMLAGFDP